MKQISKQTLINLIGSGLKVAKKLKSSSFLSKMVCYSHSRITTYENCPYQYKLKYIDRVPPESPTTIEAFMGDMVHQTLEHLYKLKRFKKRVALNVLVKFYRDLWERNYSEDILIVKAESEGLTADNYRKMGEKFIKDYYDRMKPFDEMIILGLETQDRMTLPDGNQWHVRIDKLGCDKDGNYFVCDYKTNSRMKDQEEADEDKQLAMYSIWVKDKFEDVKSVKLIWHMLAFNKDAVSERASEQLEKLQQEICDKIKEIEEKTAEGGDFPRNQTALCDYCGYKKICPSFKHEAELKEKESVKKFKEDEGVRLVDKYFEIKAKLSELKKAEEEFKKKLVDYSKQFDVDVVYGSNMKCGVKEFDKLVMPEGEDKDKFIQLIKDKGLWDDYSMINHFRVKGDFSKGQMDEDLKGMCEVGKDFRLSLSKRKDVEDE
jgi:putative RecB family exonuclease